MNEEPDDLDDTDADADDEPEYFTQPGLVGAMLEYVGRCGFPSLNSRQINAIIRGATIAADEIQKPHVPATPGMGLYAWIDCDETGASSKYLAAACRRASGGQPISGNGCPPVAYPHDAGDFGRCVGLLDAVPFFREYLPCVSESHPVWAKLVEQWADLEAAYRKGEYGNVSERITEIVREAERG